MYVRMCLRGTFQYSRGKHSKAASCGLVLVYVVHLWENKVKGVVNVLRGRNFNSHPTVFTFWNRNNQFWVSLFEAMLSLCRATRYIVSTTATWCDVWCKYPPRHFKIRSLKCSSWLLCLSLTFSAVAVLYLHSITCTFSVHVHLSLYLY